MRAFMIFLAGVPLLLALAAPSPGFVRGTAPQPKIGGEFPDFALPDVDGRIVFLSEFRGKPIILSFWSCYTDTCFTSVRVIERLLKDLGEEGLVAPTVCSEIPPALEKNNYSELLKRCGTGQVVLIDEGRKLSSKYEIRTFPRTYLIGKDFTVRERIIGVPPLMRDEFSEAVKALVNE